MRPVWVIACRELRSLFASPLFYVVAGLCSVIWSILYFAIVQQLALDAINPYRPEVDSYQYLGQMIGSGNFIMILACAALTMRLFAEEKKTRTYDLLMTSPITPTQLVLGKYVGALLGAWGLVLVSAIYPMTLAPFTSLPWGPLAASYLGLMLMVAIYMGLGMFASTLTESAPVAVVMSLIFSVGIWFIGSFSQSAEGPILAAVMNHLSIAQHLMNFINGSVGVASTVFMLSLIFIGVFLSQRVVESSRWR